MQKLAIIIFTFQLLFEVNPLPAQEMTSLRINPTQAYGGNVSDYFDSIAYIPLETTKESLFGDIKQLIVTDSSFVILDNDTKAVLFFDITGKFISKIKFNDHSNPGIFFERDDRLINIVYYNERTGKLNINYYSVLGVPSDIGEVELTNIQDFLNQHLLDLGDGYYLKTNSCYVGLPSKAKDTTINLIDIYHDQQIYKSFLPYNQQKDAAACSLVGGVSAISPNVKDGAVYIATPLTHLLYKITKDTAIKYCRIVFPTDRSIPTNIITSQDKNQLDSFATAFMNNTNMIPSIGNIFFHHQLLFFKIYPNNFVATASSESVNQYNFIYDTISRKLVSLERMNPDATTYFLPFFQNRGEKSGLEFKGGNFYSPISSLKMFAAYEKNKSRHPQYPPQLQEYFNTQNRRSNPVVVKMKLKDL